MPPYPGLRRFPDGRDFSQWTGDDSKALMKVIHILTGVTRLNANPIPRWLFLFQVYLSAIAGHLPSSIVQAMATFMDACYIARRNAISEPALAQFKDCVSKFHHLRNSFIALGVRSSISLPRQHALSHYRNSIRLFGSPNGICSSITESKHIKAVKEPWRRSSRFNALKQMLRTLERLSKMATLRQIFSDHKMTNGTTSSYTANILRQIMDTETWSDSEGTSESSDDGLAVGTTRQDNDDDDEGAVAGTQPTLGESFSDVKLAFTTRTCSI